MPGHTLRNTNDYPFVGDDVMQRLRCEYNNLEECFVYLEDHLKSMFLRLAYGLELMLFDMWWVEIWSYGINTLVH